MTSPRGRSKATRRVDRFDVWLVNLDPTVGSEIQKTRPTLIISPDVMNHRISTVIVAPMTTGGKLYPSRIACMFEGKEARIVLDQIRTVDKVRLARRLGRIDELTQGQVLSALSELFAP